MAWEYGEGRREMMVHMSVRRPLMRWLGLGLFCVNFGSLLYPTVGSEPETSLEKFGKLITTSTGPLTKQEEEMADLLVKLPEWTTKEKVERGALLNKLIDYLVTSSFYKRTGALELVTSLIPFLRNGGVKGGKSKRDAWDGEPLILMALKVASSAPDPSSPALMGLFNALIENGVSIHNSTFAWPTREMLGSPVNLLCSFAQGRTPLEITIEVAQTKKNAGLYSIATRMVNELTDEHQIQLSPQGFPLSLAFKKINFSLMSDDAYALVYSFLQHGIDSKEVPEGAFRKGLASYMLKQGKGDLIQQATFDGRLTQLETALKAEKPDMDWVLITARRLAAFGNAPLKGKSETEVATIGKRLLKCITHPNLVREERVWVVAQVLLHPGLITDYNQKIEFNGESRTMISVLGERLIKASSQEKKTDEEFIHDSFLLPVMFYADVTTPVKDIDGSSIPLYKVFGRELAKAKEEQYAFHSLVGTIMKQESPIEEALERKKCGGEKRATHPEILTEMLKTITETIKQEGKQEIPQKLTHLSAELIDHGADPNAIDEGNFRTQVKEAVQKLIDTGTSARIAVEEDIDSLPKLQPLPEKPTVLISMQAGASQVALAQLSASLKALI